MSTSSCSLQWPSRQDALSAAPSYRANVPRLLGGKRSDNSHDSCEEIKAIANQKGRNGYGGDNRKQCERIISSGRQQGATNAPKYKTENKQRGPPAELCPIRDRVAADLAPPIHMVETASFAFDCGVYKKGTQQ